MSIKTVRLDRDTEKVLAVILRKTDLSITGVIKKSLLIFYEKLQNQQQRTAFEVYQQLDLGTGDADIPPSTNTRQSVLKVLKKKHKK